METLNPSQIVALPPTRRIFHAVERHEEPRDARKEQAQASWDVMYAKGVIPVHVWNYPRNATDIGAKRALPYLRDIIYAALDQMTDTDVCVWTNDDINLHPEIADLVEFHVSVFGPCCSQRIDFKGKLPPANTPVEKVVKLGSRHMGRDLFAATKRDWIKILDQSGDPILGASDFDLHVACIVREWHGIETTRRNLEQHLHPAELPLGYVMHRAHVPKWADKRNVNSCPSQAHNRLAFKLWAEKRLPSLKFHPGNII